MSSFCLQFPVWRVKNISSSGSQPFLFVAPFFWKRIIWRHSSYNLLANGRQVYKSVGTPKAFQGTQRCHGTLVQNHWLRIYAWIYRSFRRAYLVCSNQGKLFKVLLIKMRGKPGSISSTCLLKDSLLNFFLLW